MPSRVSVSMKRFGAGAFVPNPAVSKKLVEQWRAGGDNDKSMSFEMNLVQTGRLPEFCRAMKQEGLGQKIVGITELLHDVLPAEFPAFIKRLDPEILAYVCGNLDKSKLIDYCFENEAVASRITSAIKPRTTGGQALAKYIRSRADNASVFMLFSPWNVIAFNSDPGAVSNRERYEPDPDFSSSLLAGWTAVSKGESEIRSAFIDRQVFEAGRCWEFYRALDQAGKNDDIARVIFSLTGDSPTSQKDYLLAIGSEGIAGTLNRCTPAQVLDLAVRFDPKPGESSIIFDQVIPTSTAIRKLGEYLTGHKPDDRARAVLRNWGPHLRELEQD